MNNRVLLPAPLILLAQLAICLATIGVVLAGCETSSADASRTGAQSSDRTNTPASQSNLRSNAPTAGSMNGNLGGMPRNTMGH